MDGHELLENAVGRDLDNLQRNKYFSLGPDPLAAIAALGFTRELTGFARGGYEHETLPLVVRCEGSQEGWFCVHGRRLKTSVESIDSLKSFVLASCLEELRKRGAK